MTVVVDYGAGNLRSVLHALQHLGVERTRVVRSGTDAAYLQRATRIILPGVGAFGAALTQLRATGLTEPLREAIAAGRPYLGICLGMQFLYEGSEEAPGVPGLAILRGYVRRFPDAPACPVPHMGWNQLRARRVSPLLAGIPTSAYCLFRAQLLLRRQPTMPIRCSAPTMAENSPLPSSATVSSPSSSIPKRARASVCACWRTSWSGARDRLSSH